MKRSIRTMQWLVLVASAALMLGVSGCSRAPEAALRIGTNVWIGSEPLYLARELGRLDPATVQLVEYPSASEVLRAFRNQAIDGMVISLDELFSVAADGLQPRIILVVDVSHGAERNSLGISRHPLAGSRRRIHSSMVANRSARSTSATAAR